MQKEQIQWLPGTNLTAGQLMKWHTRAMYTFNLSGRLLLVNEPWPNPPKVVRMFLTRSLDGDIFYQFRSDLTESLIGELTKWAVQEKTPRADSPRCREEYLRLPDAKEADYGPCYWIPELPMPDDVVFLNQENIQSFLPDAFSWLAQEIPYVLPCAAVIQNGQAVTICRSVRISDEAAEAGLETLFVYRGRGYAGLAVMAWARAVRKEGRMPLYSTS